MIKVNEENFENEVIKSGKVAAVDFYSENCMPCRQLMPILEDVEKEYDGEIKFVKSDIADSYRIAEKYGVMVTPTLLFFKDGKVCDQVRGLVDKEFLSDKICKIIN